MKAAKDAARKTRYITGGGGGGLLERELARGLTLRCSTCHYFCSLPVLESVFVSSGSFACVDLFECKDLICAPSHLHQDGPFPKVDDLGYFIPKSSSQK